jgi:hypothetical protein
MGINLLVSMCVAKVSIERARIEPGQMSFILVDAGVSTITEIAVE